MQNLDLVFFAVLFVIGYFPGRSNERRHYVSIRRREAQLAGVLVFTNRFPPADSMRADSGLVSGSAVISEDFFKGALALVMAHEIGHLRLRHPIRSPGRGVAFAAARPGEPGKR